ncbi:cytochrome P450 [Rhizophagus irregularis DAOM 181602=DAOM 197198]|nr:cytochrome P450 [Rhizophagus irregularis DAOM 181602=DAOM 197198]
MNNHGLQYYHINDLCGTILFTRVNPLPGPFPFPFVGNLPQYYLWSKGDTKKFYDYNYKKYGDIYEIQFNERSIILSRTEYIEKLLTPSTKNSHMVRFPDTYFDTLSDEKSDHPLAIVDDSVKLVQALRKHLIGFIMFVYVPPFLRHYIPFFKNNADDLLQNVRFINKRLDEIIKKRRQAIENTPLDKPLTNDMLTSLITSNTPRDVNQIKTVSGEALNRPMTDTEIRGSIFDGFLGGTDTTANTISFIIYYLAHNQDVKKKMIEEIDRIFQGDKTRPITENDFQKLKYCEAIVKEVSRVLSVVPTFTRYINKPDEIAGYQWPAGTMFRINANAVHYNKDYWEDSDKFNPDRWMVEGFEPNKHSLLMFGGGLRICPGRKLAMIELICLMALLYRKYEIDLVDMNVPLKVVSGGVTSCTELLVEIKPKN